MNLTEPILRHARTRPQTIALIERQQAITYSALADQVLRIVGHLTRLGVARGDWVGLCLNDDSQHIAALLAVARLGAIAIQIDPLSRPAERARIADAFPLRLALATPDSERGINCPKHILDPAWHSAVAATDPASGTVGDWHAPMVVLASSGTTGLPKFTIASHLEYFLQISNYLEVVTPKRHRYLTTLPLHFSAGRVACLSHLLRGDTLILSPTMFSPTEFLESVERHQVTAAFLVPSVLRQLLSITEHDRSLLPNIDLLMSAGAPLFAEEKRRIVDEVSPRFCELYGAAAIGPMTALRPEEFSDRPASVGRPFPLIDIDIVDEKDRPVDIGAIGVLRCRGPSLTSPIASACESIVADFRDGWYYPGELASVDEHGYIFLQGRTSEVVFRGGAKIFPAEVEAVLQAHDAVIEAAVLALESSQSKNEQVLIAYVTCGRAVMVGELIAHCRTHLTAFKVPREINIVSTLPKGSSGKTDKRALRLLAEKRENIQRFGRQ